MPEAAATPPGIPPRDTVKAEVKRMGFSDEDGDYIYDFWLSNGFKTGKHKIVSWTAVLRNWKTNQWFPSQKKGLKDRTAKTDWSKYK